MMNDQRCTCSMSISMLGDGCRYCQPQEYIDRLGEWLDEQGAILEKLEDSAVVPEGWKRVPLKPTSEMMFAPAFGAVTGTLKPSTFSDIYQAMIAAAPQPPEQEQES
jgi:hypothetical protein